MFDEQLQISSVRSTSHHPKPYASVALLSSTADLKRKTGSYLSSHYAPVSVYNRKIDTFKNFTNLVSFYGSILLNNRIHRVFNTKNVTYTRIVYNSLPPSITRFQTTPSPWKCVCTAAIVHNRCNAGHTTSQVVRFWGGEESL